jgi:hypothetical protein
LLNVAPAFGAITTAGTITGGATTLGAEASDPHGVNCESIIKAAEEVAVQAQAKQQDILV